jgi:hypothetical protein
MSKYGVDGYGQQGYPSVRQLHITMRAFRSESMTADLGSVLVEAINDEYMARAMYCRVIEKFGEVRPFVNIVEAESRHIQALLPLFRKYGIPVPEDDWESRVEAPASVLEACNAGVQAEIANADMYARLLDATTQYPDVQSVLRQLQRASRENHLPAFQRCVASGGSNGGGRGMGRRQRRGQGPR